MICPILSLLNMNRRESIQGQADGFNCFIECAWWDKKKGQCAIVTLAQKDNSKVSIAR